MTAFGIDFSLTSTGLASWDGVEWDRATIKSAPKDSSPGAFLDRIDDIVARIITWCDPHEGDVLCIEGPALHAKSSQLDRMFGGWWMVYGGLREHHAEPWVIPPTVVKQLATGSGNASKDAVLIQTVKRLAVDVRGNDEADAAWLAVAGAHIAGLELPARLPEKHLDGLAKLVRNRDGGAP